MTNTRPAPPNDPLRQLLEAADKAAQGRDFSRSIELLREAAQLAPRNANILFSLGTMHGKRYDFAAMKDCFAQAIVAAPDAGQALISAAGRCLGMEQDVLAEEYFTRAAGLANPHPVAFVGLAEVHERAGKFSGAMEFAAQALRIDPQCAPALLVWARLQRRAGELKDAETVLRGLADDGERKLSLRVEAGCELAAVLDQQEDHDAAMAAVIRAKGLLKPPPLVAGFYRRLCDSRKKLEDAFCADGREKWKNAPGPALPLVVLGGQSYGQSGSGFEQSLAIHDEIFYVENSRIFLDEVCFPALKRFARPLPDAQLLDALTPDELQEMRNTYLHRNEAFRQKAVGSRVIVEKNHVFNSLLPAFIRVFPETRLLLLARDPRDACLENFMQFQPVNPCSCPFLTLAGSVEENVAAMEHWQRVMASGHPHLKLQQEELMARPEQVASQICSFLRIRPSGVVTKFSSAWRVGNWKNYQKYLEPYLAVLDPLAEAMGY